MPCWVPAANLIKSVALKESSGGHEIRNGLISPLTYACHAANDLSLKLMVLKQYQTLSRILPSKAAAGVSAVSH